jgi:hypothetical protein
VRHFVLRCPRDGARREEQRFTRKSDPRLWPRHDHVEEQATERHTDRERVGQLGSPPFAEDPARNVIDSMRSRHVADIGPVSKIWRAPVVHAVAPAPDRANSVIADMRPR